MEASNTEQKPVRTISPQRVTIIATLIALICPLIVQFYDYGGSPFGDITIVAMTWVYYSSSWMGPYGGLMMDPFMLLQSLPFTFMRFVFGYMLYRLYSGKSTIKRVMLTGIIMELFMPVIYLVSYLPMLLMNPGWFSMPVLLPIPILLLYGVVIIKLFPSPKDELWIETDIKTTGHWWEKREDTTDSLEVVDDIVPKSKDVEDAVLKPEDDWLKED